VRAVAAFCNARPGVNVASALEDLVSGAAVSRATLTPALITGLPVASNWAEDCGTVAACFAALLAFLLFGTGAALGIVLAGAAEDLTAALFESAVAANAKDDNENGATSTALALTESHDVT
jgi:hypothetical protein